MIADSNTFNEIYEKIEDGKRKHISELENTKIDFYKELELGDYDENIIG